ncbi:hypothetical protein [Mycobacterium sp. 1245805.9]|uniref:hypothetical protein n=1 Tax=Mycobacterium sp. 1245805.9 TaxID=1856862 RepID=UPI000800D1BA|nr:hypothetical protein [Mycobacterium sp. 1245805.9]OBI80424.1 hypothetical protein A9X00_11135 [Mycobacterium sp. 1245805.9]
MTTHEHPTETTPTFDEPPTDSTPSADEPTTSPVSSDPSTASTQPPPPLTGTPSGTSGESPNTDAEAGHNRETDAGVAHTSEAQRESPTEENLFADDELADLRARWAGVQAAFVDDPRDCVQKADVLVSDLVDQLTSGFAHARSRLEEQWARGEEASTEDLRVALMHYREFFERLLAV